jgi:hypothetical protein
MQLSLIGIPRCRYYDGLKVCLYVSDLGDLLQERLGWKDLLPAHGEEDN